MEGEMMNVQRFAVVLLGTALAVVSCGPKQIQLMASPDIPAAQSTVKVSTSNDGNTKIDLAVQHMAPPERVDPGATVYVVWVRGNDPGAQPQNLGALKVNDKLKGSMNAVTPLRMFELYVTAEPSRASTSPTGKTLLNTTVSMK
jgi:hypothetical protein